MNRHVAEMVGKRFGKLTVVSHHSRGKGYLCQCDCGGQTLAKTHALKTGKHASCSCGKTAPRPKARKPDHQAAKLSIYRNYRRAAERRGHVFDLDFDTFCLFLEGQCHYCGSLPHRSIPSIKAHRDFKYNGVDRVENSKGYSPDNCVSCCDTCNTSKAALPLEHFTGTMDGLDRAGLSLSTASEGTFNDYPFGEYAQAGGNGSHPMWVKI